MSEQVKECPFCGEQPEIEPWHGGGPQKHLVLCDCRVTVQVTGETKALAIQYWNARESAELARAKEQGRLKGVVDSKAAITNLPPERQNVKGIVEALNDLHGARIAAAERESEEENGDDGQLQAPVVLADVQQRVVAELRRVISALGEFKLGCAYTPVYRHVGMVEDLLVEMRESISKKEWGR